MAKLAPSRKKKILIVDDDQDVRSLLREILESVGYEVREAQDGLEAIDRLSAESVDLLITDRAMPNMDGMALLAKVQETHPLLPALMISAYGEEAMWGQAIGLGASDYILKPFRTEEVIKSVHRLLRGGKKK